MASCISSVAWTGLMVTLIYCEAATISPGDGPRSFSWPASDHPSHQYSRNQIPVTAVQKIQYFGDVIQGKPLAILMRTVVQSNLQSSFAENTAASDNFVVNNSPRGGENVIPDVNMMGDAGLLRKRLSVRRKRCGKGVAKKIKINSRASNVLKAAGMKVVYDEVPQNTSTTKRGSEENIPSNSSSLPKFFDDDEKVETISDHTSPSLSSVITTTADSPDSSSKETISTGTTVMTYSSTTTETNQDELSSDTEATGSITTESSEESTTTSETTTESSEESTITSETTTENSEESTTASESSEESTTTSETTTESSPSTDATETVSNTETIYVSTTKETTAVSTPTDTTSVSTKTETDKRATLTISEAVNSSMSSTPTSVVASFSTTAKVTREDSSSVKEESTSSTEITTLLSTRITKEIDTEDSSSATGIVTSSMQNTTAVSVEDTSGIKGEETTDSLVKTSAPSMEVVTEAESSSTFTEKPYTTPVHSTNVDYKSSSRDDSESFTTDAYTKREDKNTVLSPATVGWIVIGILLVLATFSGLIFLIHKYRPVYQRRDDTIALVRNPHHRTYY